MRKYVTCTHVRMHPVLSWLIVHPVLHDLHLAAPSTEQSPPLSAKPSLHVHVFAANGMAEKQADVTVPTFVQQR